MQVSYTNKNMNIFMPIKLQGLPKIQKILSYMKENYIIYVQR